MKKNSCINRIVCALSFPLLSSNERNANYWRRRLNWISCTWSCRDVIKERLVARAVATLDDLCGNNCRFVTYLGPQEINGFVEAASKRFALILLAVARDGPRNSRECDTLWTASATSGSPDRERDRRKAGNVEYYVNSRFRAVIGKSF